MPSNNIFETENEFYAKSKVDRISKLLAHYELYKKVHTLDGDIFEFGVFKGVSLIQWASFRDILGRASKQKIVGFDTFDEFPETEFEKDKEDFIHIDNEKLSLKQGEKNQKRNIKLLKQPSNKNNPLNKNKLNPILDWVNK